MQPQDKYTLTLRLQQLDHFVATTGDGTSDPPVLKKADVGFSIEIYGTEAAK